MVEEEARERCEGCRWRRMKAGEEEDDEVGGG